MRFEQLRSSDCPREWVGVKTSHCAMFKDNPEDEVPVTLDVWHNSPRCGHDRSTIIISHAPELEWEPVNELTCEIIRRGQDAQSRRRNKDVVKPGVEQLVEQLVEKLVEQVVAQFSDVGI